MADRPPSGAPDSAADLAAALAQFRTLVDPATIGELQPCGPAAVYTPWVTVWLLVYQRLHRGASLQTAVAEFARIADAHSSNKRMREGTFSSNTGAYSRARSRLLAPVAEAVADHVFATVVAATPPAPGGRRVFTLDGTTLALASNDRLRERWPPGANKHGPNTWPIGQLVLAHELESGAAVRAEVGAM